MFDLRVFFDLGQTSDTHPAVPMCYQYGWHNYGIGFALTQAALERYRSDDTDLLNIPASQKKFIWLHCSEQIMVSSSGLAVYEVAMKRYPTLFTWKLTRMADILRER